MTAYFVQRIDEGRHTTPRPNQSSYGDAWLLLLEAATHADAVELAYKRWHSEQYGCVGFIRVGAPGEVVKPWRLRVWDKGEALVCKTFAVSHSVVTTYFVTEEASDG